MRAMKSSSRWLSVATNLVPWQRVAEATGAKLVYMYPGKDGRLTLDELDKKLPPRPSWSALQWSPMCWACAPPWRRSSSAPTPWALWWCWTAPKRAPHTHNVKKLDVDFAACSAHKLYAPMGVGALYARAELLEKMPPFLSGGDMIGAVHEHKATWAEGPRKFEAGTRNIGGEVGFAAAIEYRRHQLGGYGTCRYAAEPYAVRYACHALADRLRRAGGRWPLRRRQLQRQRCASPRCRRPFWMRAA